MSAALWVPMLAAARDGVLTLQVCRNCKSVQYPPSELCRDCLGDDLDWQPVDGSGTVLAVSVLEVTNEEHLRSRLPWRIATVRLDCGPVVFVNLPGDAGGGARVRISPSVDADRVILGAAQAKGDSS